MNVVKTPMTAIAVVGTLLMAAAVVVLPARGFADGPTATPSAPPAATPSAPRALPGTIAPDFALRSLDGSTVKLSDFRGKAVILNFWATWCAPCRDEIPSARSREP
jgi:thiol-disulfide isomerase/thioredoxin